MPPKYEYVDKTGQLLKKGPRDLKNQRLTDLAEKYSHPSTNNYPAKDITSSPLAGTFKSGFTPTSPFFSGVAGPYKKRRIFNHQKRRFYGFSAVELQELGVLAGVGDDPYDETYVDVMTGNIIGRTYRRDLDNPIHPLYARQNWEKESDIGLDNGPIPVRGEDTGYWLVSNDNIWAVLEPCLQLVSLLLDNANWFPWFDAILHGEIREVDPTRVPSAHVTKELYSIHMRPPAERNEPLQIQKTKDKLKAAAGTLMFRLSSGYCNPYTGAAQNHTVSYGMTRKNFMKRQPSFTVDIATELLQPLLTGELNYDERMLAQFQVATTILHETGHALWEHRYYDVTYDVYKEPYFEDETLPEMGWSLENHIWGGEPKDLNHPTYFAGGPGLPSMGVVRSYWFNECSTAHGVKDMVPLDEVKGPYNLARGSNPFYYIRYWPIPTTWFKDMHKKDKWEHLVRKFGADSLEMGPMTLGSEFRSNDRDPRNLKQKKNSDSNFNERFMFPAQRAALNPDEKVAAATENQRREKALEILKQMRALYSVKSEFMSDEERAAGAGAPVIEPMEVYTCKCPRYDAIKKHFLGNRGPQELAFDSMEFDIPEPTLLRYIQDRGGISLDAEDLRSFLHCCNVKKELFNYRPFPGTGMVTRIPAGWPAAPPKPIRAMQTPDQANYDKIKKVLLDNEFQDTMYGTRGEFRDMPIGDLGDLANSYLPAEEESILRDELPLILHEMAIRDPAILTLGPKNIVRLRTPIQAF
ncbi:uncharacterized protein LY89DRAFT_783262, partial [Mollisia scopiformis]